MKKFTAIAIIFLLSHLSYSQIKLKYSELADTSIQFPVNGKEIVITVENQEEIKSLKLLNKSNESIENVSQTNKVAIFAIPINDFTGYTDEDITTSDIQDVSLLFIKEEDTIPILLKGKLPPAVRIEGTPKDPSDPSTVLSYALGYNFSGDAGLNNITPEVFLGWTEAFKKFDIEVGPVIFANQGIVDSSSAIPALLLPGNVNFIGNFNFYIHNGGKKHRENPESSFGFLSAGVGMKFISTFNGADSIGSLAQQFVKITAGFKYKQLFTINASFVYGAHNITQTSEDNFRKIFEVENTDISYLAAHIQTQITGKSKDSDGGKLYLFFAYRYLLNQHKFLPYPPNRLLSIGISQDFDFKRGVRATNATSGGGSY